MEGKAMGNKEGKGKKIALGVALAGIGVAGTAQGAVYIAPPDVDQYKQKTDQSFYDLYQNPNSPMNVNPRAKRYLNNFSTDQKALEGYVLPSLRGGVIQGAHIPPGAKATVVIAGVPFMVETDQNGKVRIRTRGLASGAQVKKATLQGFAEVSKKTGKTRCTSWGKYGCTQQNFTKRDIYFNAVSGDYIVRDYEVKQNRACGKFGGKYATCKPWNNEQFVKLINVQKGTIDLARVLKEGRTFRVAGDNFVKAYAFVDEQTLVSGLRAKDEYGKYSVGHGKYGNQRPGGAHGKYGNQGRGGKYS